MMTAEQQIDALKDNIKACMVQIKTICDANQITTYLDFEGQSYTCFPKRMTQDESIKLIESGADLTPEMRKKIVAVLRGDDTCDYSWQSSYEGWMSSSDMC